MLKYPTPLLSIITPVYNVERYLRQCIDSVIAQTFQSWELWLIDDGSTDSSGAICDEYAARDARIRVVHKENTGLADSRNLGISLAKTKLIGFVDSDDWIEADMYEILYNTQTSTQADIVVCGHYIDSVGCAIPSCEGGDTVVYEGEEALWLLLEDKEIKSFAWDKLYNRDVMVAPYPKYFYYEDYATAFKWFAAATKVAKVNRPEYHYRKRRGSICNDKDSEKAYHFFLAEVERYNYALTHSVLARKKHDLAVKVVKTGLAQSKGIVRNSINHRQGVRYLNEIRNKLAAFDFVSSKDIGLKRTFKRWRLVHFPSYYYYEVCWRDKLKYKRKKGFDDLYE